MSKRATVAAIVAVIAVVGLCLCALVAVVLVARAPWASRLVDGGTLGQARNVEAASEVSQQFDVGPNSVLVVENEVGSVNISAGTTGVVTVLAQVRARAASDEQASALLSEVRVDASGDGDRVTVTVDIPDDISHRGNVEVQLTIVVPSGTSVQARTLVGDVTARGTRGGAELGADVGNVGWTGALPDSGAVTLTTSVGNVSFEAPADSAFHLNATTTNGKVNSALALAGSDSRDGGLLSDAVAGDYGVDPQVDVELRTSVGNVDVTVR